jgi:hypothetical protein
MIQLPAVPDSIHAGSRPSIRSNGDFRDHLRSFARKLDDLAQSMRAHVLARTVYTPAHFALVPDYDVVAPPAALSISPRCNRWPIGALDLRYHDDAFFAQFFKDLSQSELTGGSLATKFAGMDLRWRPPANLVHDYANFYRITSDP